MKDLFRSSTSLIATLAFTFTLILLAMPIATFAVAEGIDNDCDGPHDEYELIANGKFQDPGEKEIVTFCKKQRIIIPATITKVAGGDKNSTAALWIYKIGEKRPLICTYNNEGDTWNFKKCRQGYEINPIDGTIVYGETTDTTAGDVVKALQVELDIPNKHKGKVTLYVKKKTDTTIDDEDGDGIDDEEDDNCVGTPNPDQKDSDEDGVGDACEQEEVLDTDADGVLDNADNCPNDSNTGQEDADNDEIGDACDTNEGESQDIDSDDDSILDGIDNCPLTANVDQADADGDRIGDACDPEPAYACDARQTLTSSDDLEVEPTGSSFTLGAARSFKIPQSIPVTAPAKSDTSEFSIAYLTFYRDSVPATCKYTGTAIGSTWEFVACYENLFNGGTGLPTADKAGDDFTTTDVSFAVNATTGPISSTLTLENTHGCEAAVIPNDQDSDGKPDATDNCPAVANPEQTDTNSNGIGDVCETAPTTGGGTGGSGNTDTGNQASRSSGGGGSRDFCSNPPVLSTIMPIKNGTYNKLPNISFTVTDDAAADGITIKVANQSVEPVVTKGDGFYTVTADTSSVTTDKSTVNVSIKANAGSTCWKHASYSITVDADATDTDDGKTYEESNFETDGAGSLFSDEDDYLGALNDRGVLNSDGNTQTELNRATAAQIIANILGLVFEGDVTKNPFPDVSKSSRQASFISLLKDAKIVKGYGDGLFRPMNTITRAEAYKILYLASGKELTIGKTTCVDLEAGAWYVRYMQSAFNDDIIIGGTEVVCGPNRVITHGEFAELVVRFFGIK